MPAIKIKACIKYLKGLQKSIFQRNYKPCKIRHAFLKIFKYAKKL